MKQSLSLETEQISPMNKKLVQRYYAAWNTLNTDNPASFYAKDANLVFFDVVPFKYDGWGEYKKGVEKFFFSRISAGKLTPNNDLKITRRGDVAWMTLTFHLSFTLKTGEAIEMDCRHTAIWQNRRGKWLIVHEHISAPAPA
jgi:ketosteroid isomerase-like protein